MTRTICPLSAVALSLLLLSAQTRADLVEFYPPDEDQLALADTAISGDGSTTAGLLNGGGEVAQWRNGTLTTLSGLGGSRSDITGISDNGRVIVGTSATSSGGASHAVIWRNGVITDLGTLGSDPDTTVAVTPDGTVVIGTLRRADDSADYAFRWQGGQLLDLGTLGGSSALALAVSEDGNVVVGRSLLADNFSQHAFRWQNNIMEDLGDLGGNYSYGVATSADGSVVVGNSLLADDTFTHAFRWTSDGMVDLNTLGGHYSYAQFVSRDGSIVVGRSILADNLSTRIFLWQDNIMNDLGTLGGTSSWAKDMTPTGSVIVGRSQTSDGVYHGMRWESAAGMQTVEEWLSAHGVAVAASGDYTVIASGVSNNGNVIIGQLSNGHSYLARLTSSGSGMIDLNDFLSGVAADRLQLAADALRNNDLTLNGLNGSPLRGLLAEGQQSLQASGDFGRHDRDDDSGYASVGEIGYSRGLSDAAQFNMALGRTWSNRRGANDSKTSQRGSWVMPEAIVRAGTTPLYITMSALYNHGDADIRRGYRNAGLPDGSHGSTGVKTWGGRLRLDWQNAFSAGRAGFTPYISHTWLQSRIDGYAERGGGFPLRFSDSQEKANTSRLGLDASWPVTGHLTLLGKVEGAHRYEARSSSIRGNLPGAGGGDFALAGVSYRQNWLRLGSGLEMQAGAGSATLMLNTTTEGQAPEYWLTAGYQLRF